MCWTCVSSASFLSPKHMLFSPKNLCYSHSFFKGKCFKGLCLYNPKKKKKIQREKPKIFVDTQPIAWGLRPLRWEKSWRWGKKLYFCLFWVGTSSRSFIMHVWSVDFLIHALFGPFARILLRFSQKYLWIFRLQKDMKFLKLLHMDHFIRVSLDKIYVFCGSIL